MSKVNKACEVEVFENEALFGEQERELFEATRKALENAYAPYSKFRVAAALRLANGKVFTGNNQENAAYPSGLCAERVAIFSAMSQYPKTRITQMALTIDYGNIKSTDFVFPCGGCRQVMVEYELKFDEPIEVFVLGPEGRVAKLANALQLMPFYFDGSLLP